jgi:enoyl-CoA hydratase/carnithine racemase
MTEQVLINVDGLVTTITLINPAKRNALSYSLMDALTRAFTEVGATQTQVVVLAANGPVFCAGHDLSELVGLPPDKMRAGFAKGIAMVKAMQAMPQPVIAKVHAMAAAGGCQLVASCDLVVASQEASFASPGIKRGLFCHTPVVAVSRAIGQKRSFEMAITGRTVDAATALDWGLINRCVPADELDAETDALVQEILSVGSPYARAMGKKAFYAQLGLPAAQAWDMAGEVVALNALMPDTQEGFLAFVEKREPVFTMQPNPE